MPRRFLSLITITISCTAAVASACTYQVEPEVKDGQKQYRFFNECGFYEVGYRLEGNTLYFPEGGTHTIGQVSDVEAQAMLSKVYGLVEVEGKALIRTKGFFDAPS